MRNQLLKALSILRKPALAAASLQVMLQKIQITSFSCDTPDDLFSEVRGNLASPQRLKHSQGAPSILPHPAKSKIIRVIFIIEKLKHFKAIQHGLNLVQIGIAGKLSPQFPTTVSPTG